MDFVVAGEAVVTPVRVIRHDQQKVWPVFRSNAGNRDQQKCDKRHASAVHRVEPFGVVNQESRKCILNNSYRECQQTYLPLHVMAATDWG